MSVANPMKNEIIRALLEDDDEDDIGLAKEVTPTDEEMFIPYEAQLAGLLPKIIRIKEKDLGKACVKIMQLTNPMGETFIFGQFGRGPMRGTVVTLASFNPKKGWVPERTLRFGEDLEDDYDEEDFKDILGEPPKKKKYLELGSYSHATMRSEDLIPRFMHALRAVDPERAAQEQAELDDISEDDAEGRDEFCYGLFDVLDEYCPPYTSFGSNEGDGSDYGCWVSFESLDEAVESGEVRAIQAGQPFTPGEEEYVVMVDRAGNYEQLLNGRTGELIWSIS
jgi:hypothetical protein